MNNKKAAKLGLGIQATPQSQAELNPSSTPSLKTTNCLERAAPPASGSHVPKPPTAKPAT